MGTSISLSSWRHPIHSLVELQVSTICEAGVNLTRRIQIKQMMEAIRWGAILLTFRLSRALDIDCVENAQYSTTFLL